MTRFLDQLWSSSSFLQTNRWAAFIILRSTVYILRIHTLFFEVCHQTVCVPFHVQALKRNVGNRCFSGYVSVFLPEAVTVLHVLLCEDCFFFFRMIWNTCCYMLEVLCLFFLPICLLPHNLMWEGFICLLSSWRCLIFFSGSLVDN